MFLRPEGHMNASEDRTSGGQRDSVVMTMSVTSSTRFRASAAPFAATRKPESLSVLQKWFISPSLPQVFIAVSGRPRPKSEEVKFTPVRGPWPAGRRAAETF